MLFFSVLCLLLGVKALAHNGSLAVAYPLEGITVDGSLEDWPSDMEVYQASRPDYGDKPEDASDLSCQFRIGYDHHARMLYVAVRVNDQSLVYDPDSGDAWDTQDGCSIHLDRSHRGHYTTPEQYFQCGKELRGHGVNANLESVKVQVGKSDSGLVYEWAVRLGDDFDINRSLGFDLDVTDKDEDGSFTWLAWGKGTQKVHYPANNGDLLLLAPNTSMGGLKGKVRVGQPDLPVPDVSIQSAEFPGMWIRVSCDQAGQYRANLPVGHYMINPVDGPQLRLNESDHVHCMVQSKEEREAPALSITPLIKPDWVGERGILREPSLEEAEVDRFVNAYMDYHLVPGVSLAMIKDSKVIFHRNYGHKNVATNEKVVEDTVFEACSLTKPVFAYAVNRLFERDVLSLDKPLVEYNSEFKWFEDILADERHKRITARHVLAHRTGLPNWRTGKLEINFEPGTGYGYSGEGFELLGTTVALLTSKDLVTVVSEEVFEPLGMENAYLVWGDTLAKRTANGHEGGRMPVEKSQSTHPGMAFSLHIDAVNYAKLLTGILSRQGLNSETYDEMLRQQFKIADPENPYEFPYGLGVIVEDTPLGKRISHTGVNPGWRCQFALFDELKIGYVVFTNSSEGRPFAEDLERFLISGKSN